jgi:hypothetical protein
MFNVIALILFSLMVILYECVLKHYILSYCKRVQAYVYGASKVSIPGKVYLSYDTL